MTTPPPLPPTYPPTPGLVTDSWQSTGPAVWASVLHQAPAPIPVLPADHHHAVDWPRVRRAVRVCVTPASVTGAVLSPSWASWALPLAATHGLTATVGLDVLTALLTGLAVATGRLPRPLATVVLVTIGAGTLELAPLAIAHHLMES